MFPATGPAHCCSVHCAAPTATDTHLKLAACRTNDVAATYTAHGCTRSGTFNYGQAGEASEVHCRAGALTCLRYAPFSLSCVHVHVYGLRVRTALGKTGMTSARLERAVHSPCAGLHSSPFPFRSIDFRPVRKRQVAQKICVHILHAQQSFNFMQSNTGVSHRRSALVAIHVLRIRVGGMVCAQHTRFGWHAGPRLHQSRAIPKIGEWNIDGFARSFDDISLATT